MYARHRILARSDDINHNKLIFLNLETRCCKYHTLNTMYLNTKHHVYHHKLSWINYDAHKNLTPTKLASIPYSTYSYNAMNTNMPYNWPALVGVDKQTHILIHIYKNMLLRVTEQCIQYCFKLKAVLVFDCYW